MTTVLLTGFAPFAGARVNPSWDAARAVASVGADDATVVAEQLPVAFDQVDAALAAALARHRPDLVIALGVAQGRAAITPERVAINLDDARIPDNAGTWRRDAAVVDGGPAAYFTTLPVKAMTAAMADAGAPAQLSTTAGTYVCNHVFYALQHALAPLPARSGFIHVPASPEMHPPAGVPTLDVETTAGAIRTAVAVALATTDDADLPGGHTH